METPSNLLATLWSMLSLTGLISMISVATVGKQRRRQLVFATLALESAASSTIRDQIRRTLRVQRASNFLDGFLRRIYFVIAIFSALCGIILLFITLERSTQFQIWLVNTATIWAGALVLIIHWRGRDDEHESKMHKKLRQAQERVLSQQGIAVYDKLTHTYTPEFWLRTLENRVRRTFRKVTPITCLTIQVEGLAKLRNVHGDEVADHVLARVGQEIKRNVRSSDIVCRCQDQAFAVALFRCPNKLGRSIAERVVSNVTHIVVEWANMHYGNYLHLQSKLARMPGEANTLVQLLQATEHSLQKKDRQLVLNEKGFVTGLPVAC
jgi:diguanylate cyclase (GGDEF)-like protein